MKPMKTCLCAALVASSGLAAQGATITIDGIDYETIGFGAADTLLTAAPGEIATGRFAALGCQETDGPGTVTLGYYDYCDIASGNVNSAFTTTADGNYDPIGDQIFNFTETQDSATGQQLTVDYGPLFYRFIGQAVVAGDPVEINPSDGGGPVELDILNHYVLFDLSFSPDADTEPAYSAIEMDYRIFGESGPIYYSGSVDDGINDFDQYYSLRAAVDTTGANPVGPDVTPSPVPLPGSLPLMGVGLLAFGWVARKRRSRPAP